MLEWIAFGATIISIYLNAKKNIWTWPTGILSCIIWAIVAIKLGTIALFVLELVLIGMSIYGWRCWLKDKQIKN